MKEKRLTIKYTGELDEKLDEALEELVKEFGWKSHGRGFDYEPYVRDLEFYKNI